jgi:hypothetical protein
LLRPEDVALTIEHLITNNKTLICYPISTNSTII